MAQTWRVRSIDYTTARAFPRLCLLARRRAHPESRGAGSGRFLLPWRAPVAFLRDLADVASVLAFFAGVARVCPT